MRKIDIILGLQWGDEGKGKIVDVLAPNYNCTCRFQGGPNAGHTIKFNENKVVLRSIPSGIFQSKQSLIGNGVVFDPVLFKSEYEELCKYANTKKDLFKRIIISNTCHVITPLHKLQDMINEIAKGKNKVGTTGKGIGPTYTDKVSRIGLQLKSVLAGTYDIKMILDNLRNSISNINIDDVPDDKRGEINKILSNDIESIMAPFYDAIDWLKSSRIEIVDTTNYINIILRKKDILIEGAQGSMLDIDFGTYPFVTSSNTISGAACTGLGIAPNKIRNIYGVFKAYCTRVGAGPFPTEEDNAIGDLIRKEGNEYGAVTGRDRRCGWLDLVQLKYACMVNGVTNLVMMKSDVLSIFDSIKVCTSYIDNSNNVIKNYSNNIDFNKIKPIYSEFKGWKNCDLTNIKIYKDLPINLRNYIDFIEKYLDIPISIVSVGPDRKQIIYKK